MNDAYEDYKARLYQEGLDKNIQLGDMVKVSTYYVSDSGIGKVVGRYENDGFLMLEVLRLMKNDYTIIRKPKVFQAKVADTEKVDVNALITALMDKVDQIQKAV
jgi:hypothetical protein